MAVNSVFSGQQVRYGWCQVRRSRRQVCLYGGVARKWEGRVVAPEDSWGELKYAGNRFSGARECVAHVSGRPNRVCLILTPWEILWASVDVGSVNSSLGYDDERFARLMQEWYRLCRHVSYLHTLVDIVTIRLGKLGFHLVMLLWDPVFARLMQERHSFLSPVINYRRDVFFFFFFSSISFFCLHFISFLLSFLHKIQSSFLPSPFFFHCMSLNFPLSSTFVLWRFSLFPFVFSSLLHYRIESSLTSFL